MDQMLSVLGFCTRNPATSVRNNVLKLLLHVSAGREKPVKILNTKKQYGMNE